jgi:hypothetical protein
MLMEKIGYLLSELPVLILMIWLAVKIVHWRRTREGRPPASRADRRIMSRGARYRADDWQFYPRFVLAVLAVVITGGLQIMVLAPLGAAIVTGVLVLTSAAIVHGALFV